MDTKRPPRSDMSNAVCWLRQHDFVAECVQKTVDRYSKELPVLPARVETPSRESARHICLSLFPRLGELWPLLLSIGTRRLLTPGWTAHLELVQFCTS